MNLRYPREMYVYFQNFSLIMLYVNIYNYYIYNYSNPGMAEIPEREITDGVRRKVQTL